MLSRSELLISLKKQCLYKQPSDLRARRFEWDIVSFSSNDYFNLSQNKSVKNSAIKAIEKYGTGGRSSRYIGYYNPLYKKLENAIARIKNTDSAMVFSSGYMAGVGAIPALVSDKDLILADKLIHSCLLDGAKLSGATLARFSHNNIKHCEELLKKSEGQHCERLIITESVFSMDGDIGRVFELIELAKKFNCLILVDDAHGLGIVDFKSDYENYLQLGTLSKAAGSLGGYVAGSKILIDCLRNFARTAIYTTALPPSVLAASINSLKIISKKKLGKKVLKNAQYFCTLMNLPKPDSAIIIIVIGDNKRVIRIAENVAKNGFLIGAIRPPTVAKYGSRLRITFSSSHTKSQILELSKALKSELIRC
jgi:8-amino-7-oxononanoate synthase